MFSIPTQSFNFVAKNTTIGGEGRPGYAGRKIVVEPGQIYVLTTGTMDQSGFQHIYHGGEILYVSDTADMRARKLIILNERAAELTVIGERDILGVSTPSDKATITIRFTLTVRDAMRLATYVISNADPQNSVRTSVEKSVSHFIENTLAIWSQPEAELVNILTTRIDALVEGYGLMLQHSNTIIQRTMPKTLAVLQAECRMADMRLLEAVEAKDNLPASDVLHEFDRKWRGVIFTPRRIEEWMAAAQVGSKHTHGKAFMQLIIACLTLGLKAQDEAEAVDSEVEILTSFLLDEFHATTVSKYVRALHGDNLSQPSQDKIQDSFEIVLNSFA